MRTAFAIFWWIPVVQAATLFYAGDGNSPDVKNATQAIFFSPNQTAAGYIGNFATFGIASSAGLGAFMTASAPADPALLCYPGHCQTGGGTVAHAGLDTDQLYYSGSVPINVKLMLKLSGSMTGTATGIDDFAGGAVAVILTVNGTTMTGTHDYLFQPIGDTDNSQGMLSGLSGTTFSGQVISSPFFALQPGFNHLRLELLAAATGGVRSPTPGVQAVSAQTLFHQTLTFDDSGPVFAGIDPGTTVQAPDIGIVDNLFQPVPEPGTGAMLAAGALILLRRALRSIQ